MMKTLFLLLSLLCLNLFAQEKGGIKGEQAPQWDVKKWHNLPNGKKKLDLTDYNDKVIYLYCFQSWCPGCHSHGFPTLQKIMKMYKGNDKVAFVAIQTVFEGFQTNTFENALKVSKKFSLSIPIGQSGENGKRSPIMKAYRTRGTPWVIIIGPKGKVAYNDFHIKEADAKKEIDSLLKKK